MHWTFWLIDIVLYLEPAHVEEELEEGEDGEDHVHSVPFLHQTIMGVNNKYTNKSSNGIFDLQQSNSSIETTKTLEQRV